MTHRDWDDDPEPIIPFLMLLTVIVIILVF
jgi:hypothetical protein